MAFIGIFLLSLFGMMAFAVIVAIIIIIVAVFIFVFIPALIISIVNLILGIKRHWPKINIILLSVFGSLTVALFVISIPVILLLIVTGINYLANGGSVDTVTLVLTPLLC